MTLEESVKELKIAWNELIKCIIYDTPFIKLVNLLGLEIRGKYKRF